MKKIGIFCVGTGGHVLPAKNLILQLNDEGVSLEKFIVVTDERGSQYLKDLDIKIYILDIYRSKIGIIGYVFNIYKVLKTILEVRSIIKKDGIKINFSTGSYIAPIASFLSFTSGIQYFGQEQNIYAGLGNKITSLLPAVIFTSYPHTKNIYKKKTIYVGPVVNKDIIKINNINNKGALTIGVQGGSQGSEEINNYIYKFLSTKKITNVNFLHITGKEKADDNLKLENYKQFEFIENMNEYYRKINFQISRSGGGALEAAFLGIPQMLIPFKHGTTSSHQNLNAQYLSNLGAAIIVNSYNEFEKNLLDIISNYEVNQKVKSNKINIQIGNSEITKYLKEALSE